MIKNVLLIDDDPDEARLFSDALGELNPAANFQHVDNGVGIFSEMIRRDGFLPDIIFLDINMPVTDGWECLRELKCMAELRSIPIVMYSSGDIENLGSSPADVGATAFMRKPSGIAELKSKLYNILASASILSPA